MTHQGSNAETHPEPAVGFNEIFPSSPSPVRVAPDALDQLSDGYYEIDRDFRYRRVNDAGARLAHKSAGEMIGRSVLDFFPDIQQSEVHRAVERVMNGGQSEQVEVFYRPLQIWGVNSIYPIAEGVAIVSRDVTAEKLLQQNLSFLAEASKALSSSLDLKRTLGEVTKLAAPRIADWCAVDMLNAEGDVELLALSHIDPAKVRWATELRKRAPIDVTAETGSARVLRTGRSEFYPAITDEMLVAAAKDERGLELMRSIGFSSAMVVPLLAGGRAIGVITFVAAESGRRYTRADLSMAEELASRAALAIENSRLFTESQKAVALRDDFISAASHELRTPVTSLKVFTEVLQRQARKRGDDQSERYLTRMNSQIDKLAMLIGDLLDVSKFEAGKLSFRREPVDLNAMAVEVIDSIQATAEQHRIALEGRIDRALYGDKDRLGQVLTNLLTNAIKYSPDSDRVIVRLSEDRLSAAIEVEDFGIGIDSEHQSRIFERFYRAASPDETTFPGLGIGLYLSSQIVQRHGGAIGVESVRNQGSIFRFTVPFGEPDAAAMRDETAP
jgi:signal transduction histidine kinase